MKQAIKTYYFGIRKYDRTIKAIDAYRLARQTVLFNFGYFREF